MTVKFRLENLDCANCAAKLERAVAKVSGVSNASVNFFASKLVFDVEDDRKDEVIEAVKKTCRKVEPECVLK